MSSVGPHRLYYQPAISRAIIYDDATLSDELLFRAQSDGEFVAFSPLQLSDATTMATARRCACDRIRNEHPARLKHAVVEAHADADHVFRCAAQAHFTLTLVSAQIPACAADVAPSDEPFQPCVQCTQQSFGGVGSSLCGPVTSPSDEGFCFFCCWLMGFCLSADRRRERSQT